MRRPLHCAAVTTALTLAVACTTTGPRHAATPAAPQPDRATTRLEMGRQLYLTYCASCHGPDARGKGKAPDLTTIAKQHGGTFPWMLVYRIINGQLSGRAHGFPGMPAWGNVFRDDAAMDINDRAAVEGRLMLLTGYLQSIQQP